MKRLLVTIRNAALNETFLDKIRVARRRSFAMSYYSDKLLFIDKWSKKFTEESNFYYTITSLNSEHLAQLVSIITGKSVDKILEYFHELESDQTLRNHITQHLKNKGLGRDICVNYGRRLGWYAFVRSIKPKVVIETGIDHGVGSCVLASALLRNADEGRPGRYYGTEIRREAGQLFCGAYAQTGEILYGDSIESLKNFSEKIDVFINDSDHSPEYEYEEYRTIRDKLSNDGIILGDNSHVTNSLSKFSKEAARSFIFFSEKPENHWSPGAGIGISFLTKLH